MNTLVDISVIYSAAAEAYFTNADRRILSGLRATLDMLRVPYPDYAERQARRPLPGKAIIAAYDADHPRPRSTTLAPRRENANPEHKAAVIARRAAAVTHQQTDTND